jgi:signal transduction histidine kinase
VRASRARIVSAGDSERRRIERNLHDGAQQRLLGVRLGLRLARGHDAAVDALLAEIDAEVEGAINDLRDLARGLHPAVLSDEGLNPALATLARRAAVPVELKVMSDVRFPPGVEAAAYYVAAEALANVGKHVHASCARIEVSVRDGNAAIDIADDGRGGADDRAAPACRAYAIASRRSTAR